MSLTQKIHEIRAIGLAVVKEGEVRVGQKVQFKFAKFADVWTTVKPELASRGLSVGWALGKVRAEGEYLIHSLVMVVTDGTESGEFTFDMVLPEPIRSSTGNIISVAPQRQANAQSYAKRTSLCAFFNISTGDEDDVEQMKMGVATRDTGPTESNEAPWYAFMLDNWKTVDAPEKDELGEPVQLGYLTLRQCADMWTKHPEHKAITARFADKIVMELKKAGLYWVQFVERFPDAELPLGAIEDCTPDQVRKAAELIRNL